ncbi:DegT/DnrJ/EryC1/StrS aminotransferase family protein [Pelagibacterales bacterium SAG-MED50]|nr:DegT/DnrJ/EryC1/StrS aminotransferase family protein [Pelagibacterales bacterium SAG-MED50]
MKLNYPSYNQKTLKKVHQVLKSGRVNYWTGNECKEFEKEFSKYVGNKYAITLSNGSVALELALKALRLKKGDEIIVSPRSFIVSASCVFSLGLKPIFADVDDNGNLSIQGIKNAYNKKVKAIIVVHLNGLACDMDPIIKFVKKNKILLIEDCSQAHGAIYKGKKLGSFGDISTWSFCQDKIISTGGEGGMISTNNKRLWLKLWSLKDHGKNYKSVFFKKHKTGFKWLHDDLGSNYRMTEIQAVIGREQLKSLDKQIKKRNLIANLYINGLKNYYLKYDIFKKPDFKNQTYPLKKNNQYVHAFYRLNLFLNKNKINQNELIQQLNKNRINCGVGSCPEIYREKIFKKLKLHPKKRLLNAKLLGETSIMFPINPNLDIKKIKLEINSIKKILNNHI